nr:hypothetical protein [Tanacetum cinerariifolium]GEX99485.1 hypothetical protein [Tanacetum cinerariifolium]
MACSVSHTDDEIQALIQKLIDEDIVRQKSIMDLALQFDNACTAKDDLRKAYEKYNDIPQESRALIDTFLKEEYDKDYEMNLSMYGKAVSATDYVNANGGIVSEYLGDIKNFLNNEKLDQVVATVKSCSPNVIDDLTVIMKDLPGTIPGTIHHKVVIYGGYGKNTTVEAALILANVSVSSRKPSMHYLNITMRNVVKVFCKDTVSGSGSG